MTATDTPRPRPAIWRVLLAAILGFITAFFVFGYLVALAAVTGGAAAAAARD